MAVRLKKVSPGSRLHAGTAVLANARAVDTRLIQDRLDRFEQAHRSYVAAQKKVDLVSVPLTAALKEVGERDAVQSNAVDALALALANEGHPMRTPFEAFDGPTPPALTRLSPAEEAAGIHELVATILRSGRVNEATKAAARAADGAASAVEKALEPIAALETTVRAARHTRDTLGRAWDDALSGLKRSARSAADAGAPELYGRLFPPRAATKTKTPETVVDESPPIPSGGTKAA